MPTFAFIRKRRQSDGAVKQPQQVNVDVEPLPRIPSKFRSMLDVRRSALFTRSAADLRRAGGLPRGHLIQGEQRPTTQSATVKISSDVPSLSRQVSRPGDQRPDSTNAEKSKDSVDGHSDSGNDAGHENNVGEDVNLTTTTESPRPPQTAEVSIMPPQSHEVVSSDVPIVAVQPSTPPHMVVHTGRLDGVAAQESHSEASPTPVSPVSTTFMTPPQRMSEEVAPPSVFTSTTVVPEVEQELRSYSVNQERRPSTRSSRSTDGQPGSPRKLSHVILSPPMPRPIAHLPTTSPSASAPWGDLARLGGPRSPSLARTATAGPSSGFPFALRPVPAVTESAEDLSDSEMRKVTRAMPVMARMPSHPLDNPADEGGDAGDDDSITDSEEAASSFAASFEPESPTPKSKGKGVVRGGATVRESSPLAQSSGSASGSGLGLSDLADPVLRVKTTTLSQSLSSSINYSGEAGTAHGDSDDDDSDGDSEPDTSSTATNTVIATPLTPTHAVRPPLFSHASKSMVNLSSPTPTSRPFLETVTEARSPYRDPPDHTAASTAVPAPPPLKRRLSAGDADPAPPKYEALASALLPGPTPKPREEEGRERLPGYWCGVHIEGTLSRKMEFTQPGIQARERAWKKYYFVLHGTALFVYKFDPTKVPLRANEPYLACDEGEVAQFLHVHPAPDRRFLTHTPANTGTRTPTRTEKQARRNTISLEGALRGTPIGAIQSTIASRRGTVGTQTPTQREVGSSSSNGPSTTGTEERDYKNPDLFANKGVRKQAMGASPVASSTASAPLASHMPFAHNSLVHIYTLQGAESGLAADYKKRQHCVRIRAEGQQFMLQTETARQCVQWIEAFQAATNVSLDLEVRPMPIQQTLPRRRRRPGQRRPQPAAAADPNAAPTSDNPVGAFEDTPEGNIAAVEAAERAARESAARERDRMLAEDQAANTGSFSI